MTKDGPATPSVLIDHFGIVVPDLAAATVLYRDVLGCTVSEPISREGQGLTKVYVQFANMEIELICPTTSDSPLKDILEDHNASDFLKQRPDGGLHHVCYAVDDLDASLAEFVNRGYRVLGAGLPSRGGAGLPISFLDPMATDGVLIELKQKPRAGENPAGTPGAHA